MDVKELRYKNLVTYLDEVYEVQGYRILKNDLGKEHIRVWIKSGEAETAKTINWIKPIPLTEDILLKFGFVKLRVERWGSTDRKYFLQKENINGKEFYQLFINRTIDFGAASLCGVGYVHDLQNIFYALTGEELTIKESTVA